MNVAVTVNLAAAVAKFPLKVPLVTEVSTLTRDASIDDDVPLI